MKGPQLLKDELEGEWDMICTIVRCTETAETNCDSNEVRRWYVSTYERII